MRPDIKNLAASVLDRLRNYARTTDQTFNEVLTYYGLERFLYRISKSIYSDRFVLKGALVMLTWDEQVNRLTNDMDFRASIPADTEEVSRIVRDICQVDVVDDAIEFDPNSVLSDRIVQKADYPGIRVKLVGYIDNVRIPIQLDISFSDPMVPDPRWVDYPVILEQPAPRIRAYRVETVVAEKAEALVYLGDINTRMKDLYDLWQISRRFRFSGDLLVTAIRETFTSRGTGIPKGTPPGLSDEFAEANQSLWGAFLDRIDVEEADQPTLMNVIGDLRQLLLPAFAVASSTDQIALSWIPENGWT